MDGVAGGPPGVVAVAAGVDTGVDVDGCEGGAGGAGAGGLLCFAAPSAAGPGFWDIEDDAMEG